MCGKCARNSPSLARLKSLNRSMDEAMEEPTCVSIAGSWMWLDFTVSAGPQEHPKLAQHDKHMEIL